MKRTFWILIAAISLSLSSCGGGGDKNNGPITPTNVAVSSISISKTTADIELGSSLQLTATVNPSNATDKTITWASSNTSVATVSPTGLVSVKTEGSANITASAGGKSATCKVTVKKPTIAVSSIDLNKTDITLDAGESVVLIATVKPDNATIKTISWESSNSAVASVDGNGKVIGVDNGTTNITASCGGKVATCKVKVVVQVKSISLSKTSETIEVGGEPLTLTATISPTNAADKTIVWSSSNTNIVTVNNGTVKAISSGTATITANASGKTATCTITVINNSEYWADGEVRLYEVNSDGSLKEVPSTSRPFKLIFTGDGYTQSHLKYGGQFDQDVDAGIKALFEVQPFKYYYNYFAVYKVAAYSEEEGISTGSTEWDSASKKVKTKFKCSWSGGSSTGIGCDTYTVIDYASKCPGMKGSSDYDTKTNLSWAPICIIINSTISSVYGAGTNIWTAGMGGMRMISIAQIPARQYPFSGQFSGFAYKLIHEYGGHGIGLLGDEKYEGSASYPKSSESTFRYWQGIGAYCNIYLPQWDSNNNYWFANSDHCNLSLTPTVEGANWKTFADREEYKNCMINLYPGSLNYGTNIYRSEDFSCMFLYQIALTSSSFHFNTISRWKIYCRIKLTAGETPSVEDFIARDSEQTSNSGSVTSSTKVNTNYYNKCEGPMLIDPYHKKPYYLK